MNEQEMTSDSCEWDVINPNCHYNDVIMGAIASQITSLTNVYSTVYSGADQRKHQEFPAQMASNAENVSIWWRHHVNRDILIAKCNWKAYRWPIAKELWDAIT